MPAIEALRVALDLLHVPSRVKKARTQPLPRGIDLLLRIAAGDQQAIATSAQLTDRTPEIIRDAAVFFIEQILLSPQSDSYRVLGATADTTSTELRRNMALLVTFFHPDLKSAGPPSVFVNRVTMAWDDVKTPELRDAYDRQQRSVREARELGERQTRHRSRKPRVHLKQVQTGGTGIWRRTLLFLLGNRGR